jgi:serine/threonine-protein phosphatase 2B catalytic subunit
MYFLFKLGLSKYDQEIYYLFSDLFEALPLASIVNGTFFCVHGGISEELRDIEDISKITRFKEVPFKGLMCDLLWADPILK